MEAACKGKADRSKPAVGKCQYYVERKKRYCKFHAAKSGSYCAEHVGLLGLACDRERMTCPYNPKHTCYVDKLKGHLKKCPSRPKEMPSYHSAGINAGDVAGETVPDPKVTVPTVTDKEIQTMMEKVCDLYDEHVKDIDEEILSHSCLQGELDNTTYGTAAMRHRKQQASLIGQMEKLGLLTDDVSYIELGAGKGQLSHWLHGAVQTNKGVGFLLVDRSHVRNKMDNLHKEEENGPVMERIRIDIEDLKLSNVSSLLTEKRAVIGYGKHLCGGATDLALRCMTETLSDREETQDGETCSKRQCRDRLHLKGTVIALCCHHRCTWKPYVGKGFFKSCGLTARDFQLISSMSSWATCTWKGWSQSRKKGQGSQASSPGQGSETASQAQGSQVAPAIQGTEPGPNELSTEGEGKPKVSTSSVTCSKTKLLGDTSATEPCVEQTTNDADNTGVKEKGDCPTTDDKSQAEIFEEDEVEHQPAEDHSGSSTTLTPEEREEVGRKCKRLIDYGRVKYLEDHGLKSCLKVYIEGFYTPENVLLCGVL